MTRRFLAYGFAISVVVHLIVLPFIRPERTVAEEPPPDVIHYDPIPTPPPAPPPTATPRPTPQPATPPAPPRRDPVVPRHPMRMLVPQQHAPGRGGAREAPGANVPGDLNGVPGESGSSPPVAAPAAAPEPSFAPATTRPAATPRSCTRPNVPATTLRALEPETPPLAQQQAISGLVTVVVSLDAQSRVVATRIQSSPSTILNGAALSAARGSQYRTEVRDCEPVAADYLFSVEFAAQ